jgi:hypothetical protein
MLLKKIDILPVAAVADVRVRVGKTTGVETY